ncbi:hypothetical protein D1AOALGA4SA_391 [Olavius algarvensis Delta 1 endosymbiont]|nr:hypothetical protein D1AOALGA4SA_391 [Olavius algarvensis Delta 1 endosymbiont]
MPHTFILSPLTLNLPLYTFAHTPYALYHLPLPVLISLIFELSALSDKHLLLKPCTECRKPKVLHLTPYTLYLPPSNIHPSPSSIQHPVSSIQYPESSIQHPVSSIQYPVSRIQHPNQVSLSTPRATVNKDKIYYFFVDIKYN